VDAAAPGLQINTAERRGRLGDDALCFTDAMTSSSSLATRKVMGSAATLWNPIEHPYHVVTTLIRPSLSTHDNSLTELPTELEICL
jgi:hypothetical protein